MGQIDRIFWGITKDLFDEWENLVGTPHRSWANRVRIVATLLHQYGIVATACLLLVSAALLLHVGTAMQVVLGCAGVTMSYAINVYVVTTCSRYVTAQGGYKGGDDPQLVTINVPALVVLAPFRGAFKVYLLCIALGHNIARLAFGGTVSTERSVR